MRLPPIDIPIYWFEELICFIDSECTDLNNWLVLLIEEWRWIWSQLELIIWIISSHSSLYVVLKYWQIVVIFVLMNIFLLLEKRLQYFYKYICLIELHLMSEWITHFSNMYVLPYNLFIKKMNVLNLVFIKIWFKNCLKKDKYGF